MHQGFHRNGKYVSQKKNFAFFSHSVRGKKMQNVFQFFANLSKFHIVLLPFAKNAKFTRKILRNTKKTFSRNLAFFCDCFCSLETTIKSYDQTYIANIKVKIKSTCCKYKYKDQVYLL